MFSGLGAVIEVVKILCVSQKGRCHRGILQIHMELIRKHNNYGYIMPSWLSDE